VLLRCCVLGASTAIVYYSHGVVSTTLHSTHAAHAPHASVTRRAPALTTPILSPARLCLV